MHRQSLKHLELKHFPVVDGCLQIGGKSLSQLAEHVGSTPFYAYDKSVIDKRIAALRALLPSQIKLHYAVKANPMPDLIKYMSSRIDGFDVASLGELEKTLHTDTPPEQISFTGPGKGQEELSRALSEGIIINIESETEVKRIASLSDQLGIRPRVTVRINPDFELKSSGLRMSGGPKQFGIDAEEIPKVLKNLESQNFEFLGFHIFSGSQSLNAEAIIASQNQSLQLAITLAEFASSALKILNIGGGFGIPYFPGETPLNIQPISENLANLCTKAKSSLPGVDLVLELGRYLIGEAGVYVCRVIDRKISRGKIFLVTDGGLHQHLAASGNFGQIVRKNYPVTIGNKLNSPKKEVASVVGRLCTPLDLLADEMELPKADIGDYVVIFQSGAYGLTASPIAFLGHPPPSEILL